MVFETKQEYITIINLIQFIIPVLFQLKLQLYRLYIMRG